MTVKRWTIAGTAAALALGGCGVSTEGAIDELGSAASGPATTNVKTPSEANSKAVAGSVIVDGTTQTTLAPKLLSDYRAAGGGTEIVRRTSGESAAFAALCEGEVDIVDSQRPLSADELAACREAGLEPVQVQIASDAVVLAAKAETDLGGDCLPLGQVRELFRAGSPIYEWSQVDFAQVPVKLGGPPATSRTFRVFARQALGAAGEPSLSDVRSDYEVGSSDTRTRIWVTGRAEDVPLAAQSEDLATSLEKAREGLRKTEGSQELAVRELSSARADQRKGRADDRPAADQAKAADRVRRAEAAKKRADGFVTKAEAEVKRLARASGNARGAARRTNELDGRVALLRFSYYELYEDQLRPIEISSETGNGKSCIFPSQESITNGSYPLSQPMLLTTTTARLERSEVQGVLSAALRRAPALAEASGLVPLPAPTVSLQRSWVEGDATPAVVIAKPEPKGS